MREDMFKVIVERPRVGSRYGTKAKIRFLSDDDWRPRVTGKQVLRGKKSMGKYLNENLAPLKRYLFKQRGRKWDDVFSEICARLDTGSTVKMHVREHLDDFVMREVRLDQDGMYWGTSYWGLPRRPDQWWPDLYVCPIDGRLKETKFLLPELGLKCKRAEERDKRRKRTYENSFRRIGATEFLVLCDGIWYRFKTSAPPVYHGGHPMPDDLIRDDLRRFRTIDHPSWSLLCKQQLSKRDLKKHRLKNGAADA